MSELLRKKDVIDAVGVAKSTISDWISEFNMYIPTVKQGNATYYKPVAVEVLLAIKEMREDNLPKPEIAQRLADQFPINADDVANSVSKVVNKETEGRSDALITVMATMGKVVEQMGRQDGQMREMNETVSELRNEVAAAKEGEAEARAEIRKLEERLARLEEKEKEQPKGFFGRLFGR